MESSFLRRIIPILIFVSLFVSVSAHAQFDFGVISGTVTDESGGVVPGVRITALDEGNQTSQHATTNSSGYYVFPHLVVGTYTVTAEHSGFKTFNQTGISLHTGEQLNVPIRLTLGAVTQTVQVTGSSRVVSLQPSTGGTVLSHQIQQLEVNGRNPINLALLEPGVLGSNIGSFNPDSVSSGSFSINGGRTDAYTVYVDGAVATRTRESGSMLGAQDMDSVQEVQVLTQNYDAEYGRSSSGQVRFVTKSGTSHFHGQAFEALRNAVFDANSWSRNHSSLQDQNSKPPKENYNDYGFDVGGPIFIPGKFNVHRDKLFFFWAEEWVKRRYESEGTATVPTSAMRQGDLSELLDPSNPFFGKTRIATDPTTGQPFQNNVIPMNRLSAQGVAILDAFPLPTPGFQQGSSNWIGTFPVYSNLRKDTFKIDYDINPKNRLSLRGTLIPWRFNSPATGRGLFKELWSRPNRTGIISLTTTFSPTLLNELSISGNSDGKGSIDYDTSCGATCERGTYGITYPYLFPGTKFFDQKIPTIVVTGLSTIDTGPYPGYWAGFVEDLTDNMTKILGNHTIKFGATIEYAGQNDQIQLTTASPPQTNNQNGEFRFLDSGSPDTTGLGIANALLGNFNDYAESGAKPETPWVATSLDWFIQDNWKATRNLTIHYGVRHSIWPAWHSKWGTLAQFEPAYYDPSQAAMLDPTVGFFVSGSPYNGIVLPGSGPLSSGLDRFPFLNNPQYKALYHDLPEGFIPTQWGLFQPRLGIAYQLGTNTVLRGGIGYFAQRSMINRDTALGGNPPFSGQATVLDGNADALGGATGEVFPFTMTIQDPTNLAPTSLEYNFTFERQFTGGMAVSAAYVGNRGIHLQRKRNINQIVQPGTIQANPGINPNVLRPYVGFGIIDISENSGVSRYNAFQVAARKTAGPLVFSAAYTLSKSTDNSSSLTDVLPNAYDDRSYYGPSDFNRTNALTFSYTYQLPFRGRSSLTHNVLGNWVVSGINQFESGTPFSARQNIDFAGIGPGSGNQFYEEVGSPTGCGTTDFKPGVGAQLYCRDAFSKPAAGTFASSQQRNTLVNPGFWQWNLALHKNFLLTEQSTLQFRVEAFNVLNHPNWGGVNSNPASSSFGRVTSKSGNRNLQFQLRISF